MSADATATSNTTQTRLAQLALSESGFVFDPMSGATFTANDTALEILRGLVAARGRAEILAALGARFATDGSDPERDLSEFVLVLKQHQLVPEQFVL